MMKSSGTVWVLDLDDMTFVKQALLAAKAHAKEAAGEPLTDAEQFQNAGVATWFLDQLAAFEQKVEES